MSYEYFLHGENSKQIVVSNVPLPDYQVDERHGSTRKRLHDMPLVSKLILKSWLLNSLSSFSVDSNRRQRNLGSLLETKQEAKNDQHERTAPLELKRPIFDSNVSVSHEKEKFSVAHKDMKKKLKVHMAKANCTH